MSSPDDFAQAASDFWRQTFVRRGAVDLLAGTGLEQMGKDLKFWCYRLDNAFPSDVHQALNPEPVRTLHLKS